MTATVTSDLGALYVGRVGHVRAGKPGLRFETRVFSLLVDLAALPTLDRRLRWFSHNRFNLVSLHDRDHGPRDGTALRPWINAILAERGLAGAVASVTLMCFPRVLGYAFNPISIYFCRDADGRLVAVLYDVRNTFGDKHGYLIALGDGATGDDGALTHRATKAMHVSPFLGSAGEYLFKLVPPAERFALSIQFESGDGERLIATHVARRERLSDLGLSRAFARHPLMTLKVIGAIHWHGIGLWLRGAPFRRRPTPPVAIVSDGVALDRRTP